MDENIENTESINVAEETKNPVNQEQQTVNRPMNKHLNFSGIFSIILVVACIILLVLFIMQINKSNTLSTQVTQDNDRISELETEIDNKDNTISKQKDDISKLQDDISKLQVKADNYDTLTDYINGGYVWSDSPYFNVSESIIVVKSTERDRKFTLTTNIAGTSTISVQYSDPSVATVQFDKNSWRSSVQLSVIPKKSGTTVVTFSADSVTRQVKVLIVVE